jgi:hypothetical protein
VVTAGRTDTEELGGTDPAVDEGDSKRSKADENVPAVAGDKEGEDAGGDVDTGFERSLSSRLRHLVGEFSEQSPLRSAC